MQTVGFIMHFRNFIHHNENDVLSSGNPARFFAYASERRSVRTGVTPLTRADGTLATSDADKATILNDQFTSVFTDGNHKLPVFGDRANGEQLRDLKATSEHVRRVLCKLHPKFGFTPDGLPTGVFKQLSFQLAAPLAVLFRYCL